MNYDKLESSGVSDYYLDLINYENQFLSRNYPLTKKDLSDLITSTPNFTVYRRQEVKALMDNEIKNIIENEKANNQNFVNNLQSEVYSKAETVEEYNKKIFNFKQILLERVWNYKQSKLKFQSKVVFENEEAIKLAIESGISFEAIQATLSDLLAATENIKAPNQVKKFIETIIDMKKEVETIPNNSYNSSLLNDKSAKLISTIKNGISSEEIIEALDDKSNSFTDEDKRNLRFVASCISKAKAKELSLEKNKEQEMSSNEKQKVNVLVS